VVIYPAIDLMDGRAVRLRQGNPRHRLDVDVEPVAAAQRWQAEGAEWLHVVDLDGALSGRPRHLDWVAAIARSVRIPVQVGGGLRTAADIEAAFAAGAARVILGTAALSGSLLREAVRRHGDRVAVALDGREGRAATEGWQATSVAPVLEAAALLVERGAPRLIYTDVRRDGMLEGPDVGGLAALIAQVSVPVIIAGGIRSIADLEAAAAAGAEGAIVGRALYDGRLALREAVRALAVTR
jgi:phosphoribosylformimino-5-aminoimidazole carboxamide ribotide isomerase